METRPDTFTITNFWIDWAVMTATGAGWGDPLERPLELVQQDLKNGYITLEQANRYYGLDKRSKSG